MHRGLNKNGYWLNFGGGWAHLAADDPAQILAGASQRLYHDTATGDWRLVIEATAFVTHATLNVCVFNPLFAIIT